MGALSFLYTIYTWTALILLTLVQKMQPLPDTSLAPSDALVPLCEGSGAADLVVVFFPGISLVPWADATRKAHEISSLVCGTAHRRTFFYWPAHSTNRAVVTATAALEAIVPHPRPVDVLIVGESYGGVAAMRLAEMLAHRGIPRNMHVVTAASPLHGTGLMPWWFVGWFSSILHADGENLVRFPRKYNFTDVRSFATTTDIMVWPLETTTVDGSAPREQDVLQNVPHGNVVMHPRLLAHVVRKAADFCVQ